MKEPPDHTALLRAANLLSSGGSFIYVPPGVEDRKSTRLNSSHANISYAVFCLKKKIRKKPSTACGQRGSVPDATERAIIHSGDVVARIDALPAEPADEAVDRAHHQGERHHGPP